MLKKAFRWVGYIEALSVVVLFGVAMPLKYLFAQPEATRVPGMIHGLLFVGYVFLARLLATQEKWTRLQLWSAYAASVAPLGTLVFDWKFLRESKS